MPFVSVEMLLKRFTGESVMLQCRLADIDKGNEFLTPLNDNTLFEDGVGGNDVFHFFRLDILSVSSKEHGLLASTDEDVAVAVHGAEVTCVEPSFLVYGGEGFFLVFIIA